MASSIRIGSFIYDFDKMLQIDVVFPKFSYKMIFENGVIMVEGIGRDEYCEYSEERNKELYEAYKKYRILKSLLEE